MSATNTGPRIVITGGPRTGKSTLSYRLVTKLGLDLGTIRHSDDLTGVLGWHEASDEVARWLLEDGPWVAEGVALVRGLRKALAANPDRRPCDHVICLTDAVVPQTRGQIVMARGHDTIFRGIEAQLRTLGVVVTLGRAPSLTVSP